MKSKYLGFSRHLRMQVWRFRINTFLHQNFLIRLGFVNMKGPFLLEILVLLLLLLKSIEVAKGLHQPIPLLQNMVFQMVQVD